MATVKQHAATRNALLVALPLIALVALLLIVGARLGVEELQWRQSRAEAGRLFSLLEAEAERQLDRLAGELDRPAENGAAARERLAALADEKGKTQRDKHLELLLLVNPWNPLPEGYVPELAPLRSNWQPSTDFQVDARCADALERMLNDCLMTGSVPEVCSAYRTQEYQQMLFDDKISRLIDEGVSAEEAPTVAATVVALPGTSEHQLGLAVDILDIYYPYLNEYQEFTGVQRWLMEHCWDYGFILRYPDGTSDITGIIYEPWHYRYVGEEYAEILRELDITLEEYIALRRGR